MMLHQAVGRVDIQMDLRQTLAEHSRPWREYFFSGFFQALLSRLDEEAGKFFSMS